MLFEIDDERSTYLDARGKTILNACPGSGKTTTVAFKLGKLLDGWEVEFGKYRGIACLSFTNVAKDEIQEKFIKFTGGILGFPHLVSTIDSFINQYITLPFYYLFYSKSIDRPRVVDDAAFLNTWSFSHSLRRAKNGRTFRVPIAKVYKPSLIDINHDGTYSYEGSFPQLVNDELITFNDYCKELKLKQFRSGILKNSDSTFVALRILRKHPEVAKMIVGRFPYLIVDEAQDTSEIQHLIFQELINNGLKNIELIGDPYQSLYEWREARPDLFIQKYANEGWSKCILTKCRRSTQPIIDCYAKLRCTGDDNLDSTIEEIEAEPIHVIYYNDIKLLLEKYEELSVPYSDCQVVVRGKSHLMQLDAIKEYKELWKISPCVPLEFISAKLDIEKSDIKTAVKRIRRCLPILIDPNLSNNYKKQHELIELISKDHTWNSRIIESINGLPDFNLLVKDWTEKVQTLCKASFALSIQPDFGLKCGVFRTYHKESINELFQGAPNFRKVTTIHKVKGKTFDSLMIVLSENSKGQSISLNDIISSNNEMPGEKTRLIYVAMSRPRWQLVVAIPNTPKTKKLNIKTIFGDNVKIYDL